MTDLSRIKRFEQKVLPHLDAAYNLARWLTRNDHDAEDVVQEAYVRALKFFDGFHGDSARPWLLTIVRHTCYTWLRHNRPKEVTQVFDDETEAEKSESCACTPETLLLRNADRDRLNLAIEALPLAFREVLVLRELEDLAYKEIATITDIPLGTVMSRLARARKLLRLSLAGDQK